jgi:hypothetical protein
VKIRNFMSSWEWTILAVIVIAISLKIYADKACIYTGCYGPFEIVLKAENGERVEDVIVKLYRVTGGGAFGSAKVTYREWAVGNTGEVILLPRGYVGKSQSPNLKIGYSIIHPDYTASRELPYVRFPNQQGVIDLGEKIIVKNKYIHDLDAAREAGRSEEEISQMMVEQQYVPEEMRLLPGHFSILTHMGRKDIFDKYWPVSFEDYAKLKGLHGKEKDDDEKRRLKVIQKQSERL